MQMRDSVRVRSSYYPFNNFNSGADIHDLGNGKAAIPGFTGTIKVHHNMMHLVVKSKHGAFYKSVPLIDFLEECIFAGNRGGGGQRGGYGRGGGYGQGGRGDGPETIRSKEYWAPNQFERNVRKITNIIKGLKVRLSTMH